MKTRIIRTIECDTDDLQFGYYDPDEDEFVKVESMSEIIEAAKKLDCSADLLTALVGFADIVKDAVRADLQAIWKRLDEMES